VTGRLPLAELAARVRAGEPRLGRTRLVCVDGPAGSGKTTLASRLAETLGQGTAVVHMDDLYEGWTMTGAVGRLRAGVLEPLAECRPGAYQRYDWDAGRFLPALVPVPVADVLLVEGCGSSPRQFDRWVTLRIWVEVPQELRMTRGIARDGAALTDQWIRWQELEAAVFEAEDTRVRADLRVDGTAGSPDGTLALLDPSPRGALQSRCSIRP
jgi:energy-coupling factor transporter ATP-binding protein EcfA2